MNKNETIPNFVTCWRTTIPLCSEKMFFQVEKISLWGINECVGAFKKKSNNNNNHNNSDNNSRKASIMPFKAKAYHYCCGFFILMQISRVIQAYFFLNHTLLCFQVLVLSLLFSDNIMRHYISHEFRKQQSAVS